MATARCYLYRVEVGRQFYESWFVEGAEFEGLAFFASVVVLAHLVDFAGFGEDEGVVGAAADLGYAAFDSLH